VYANTYIDDPNAEHVSKSLPMWNVAHDFVTEQAKTSIQSCEKYHTSCSKRNASPFRPSRLIDLEALCEPGNARLVVSEDYRSGEYAALSYCWGEDQQTMLLTTTVLDDWPERIPTEDLPPLLKDAFTVARKLNVRYLWIDAICILQDSEADKDQEIREMGKIYKNALITIAAATSSGVSTGFLEPRTCPAHLTVPFLFPLGERGTVSLAKPVVAYRPVQALETRAWTLQEYLLSPRVLMYGESEVTWHCQTEFFIPFAQSHLNYAKPFQRLPTQMSRHSIRHQTNQKMEKYKTWSSIVSDYSGRKLTYNTDKIPALLGIVSELTIFWRDIEFLGAWKTGLVSFLAWYRPSTVEQNLQRSNRAPSWSWLSMDCQVKFRPWTENLSARVIECTPPTRSEVFWNEQTARSLLTLKAKVLSAANIPKETIESWTLSFDLSTETLDESCYFLLLGITSKPYTSPVCLVLKAVGDLMYRRVGCGTKCKTDQWSLCVYTNASLV
jgi:hypothetical protein